MSTTMTDQTIVEQIRELVDIKFADASELPGSIRTEDLEGARCDKVLMSGTLDTVRLERFSNGSIMLAYGHMERPAYSLFLNPDEEIVVTFKGDPGTEPDVTSQLELAASLPVAPNERAVYGWAIDGRIEGFFYIGDIGPIELNGMTVNCSGMTGFLLEGAKPLPAVKMPREGGDEGWIGRMWDLIKDGTLMPLSGRINALPQEAWCESSANNLVWVRFEASDDQLPTFVPNARYNEWHPREDAPGEVMEEDPSFMEYRAKEYPTYKATLRGWFWE